MDRNRGARGGIAVQHRMAYQGEYFVQRYGAAAADGDTTLRQNAREGPSRLRRH